MKEILNSRIPEKGIGIWWIGQGGFVFKTSESKVIFVDPYFSDSVEKRNGLKRMVEAPIKPEEIAADFFLCTHDCLDHADPETINKIRNAKILIGPESVCKTYRSCGIPEEKIVKMSRGEEKMFGDMKIFATFAKHTQDSVGYIFVFNRITVYITGDTEYDKRLRELKRFKPDIMITCINGKWGNMNYKEAAILTKEINPKMVIPMHYGMFKENTADPEDFLRALKKQKVTCQGKILDFNRCFIYERGER